MFKKFNGTVEKEKPLKMIKARVDTQFNYYNSKMYGYTR